MVPPPPPPPTQSTHSGNRDGASPILGAGAEVHTSADNQQPPKDADVIDKPPIATPTSPSASRTHDGGSQPHSCDFGTAPAAKNGDNRSNLGATSPTPPDGERLPGDAELDGKPPVATHTQRSQDANRTARLYGLLVTHGEEYERLTNKKKDNFWMNDVLIDLFLCLLQIRLRSDNVFVMDTAFLPHRMKQCISPSSFQRKATLLDKEYFLIPCNVGKSHWILCFVIWNEIKPMVWVFDSMNSGGGETTSATAGVKTCLGAIDNFFEERFQQEKGHRREGTKGKQLLQISRGNLGFGNVAITCAISRTCCCMPLPSTTLEAERHGFTKKCPDRNMCDL